MPKQIESALVAADNMTKLMSMLHDANNLLEQSNCNVQLYRCDVCTCRYAYTGKRTSKFAL